MIQTTRFAYPLATVVILSLLLSGCPADTDVAIEPGSTLDHLTFVVSRGGGKATELSSLVIESCRSIFGGAPDKFWQVEAGEHPSRLSRLAYGTTPEGYSAAMGPRPLQRNACYAAMYGGKDELYFLTTATGEIRAITQDEAKKLSKDEPPS